MTNVYRPGRGYALVTAAATIVLAEPVDPELVARLWAVLGQREPGPKVLRELVAAAGGDFEAICPFALVLPSGADVRTVVRGPLHVTVRSAAGEVQVEGGSVVTWAERDVADVLEVEITVPGGTDDERLPIGVGVVRAGTVVVGVSAEPSAPVGAADGSVPHAEVPAANASAPKPDVPPVPGPTAFPGPFVAPGTDGTPASATPAAPVATAPDVSGQGADPAVIDRPPTHSEDIGGTTWGPGVTLVDYVPSEPDAPVPAPERTYDDLFGPTRIHAVEEAAVREVEELAAAVPPSSRPDDDEDVSDPDHDHRTVLGVHRRRPTLAGAQSPPIPAAPAPAGPSVLARRCAAGHDNPPTRTACRVCGAPVVGSPSQTGRPSLGRMRFSTGSVVELDAPVVMGRRPRVGRVAGGQLPRVVTVPSPLGEISASHLAVRLEDWVVLAVDLDSSNGTMLLRPGTAPRRLAPQEPEILRAGDVIDLGDGVLVTFEDVP